MAWQRFLPTGPIAMLPVINLQNLRQIFFLQNIALSDKYLISVSLLLSSAAVGHRELPSVVNQPSARGGAAGDG